MIAVDTNILIHAHRQDSPDHRRALNRMSALAKSSRPWGIPWPCVHEFISTVTKSVFQPPSTMDQAFEAIEAYAALQQVVLLGEGPDHINTLRRLCKTGAIIGSAVHDARIAAICLQHGVTELWTADRDFGRFPGLKVVNPLVS